MYLIQVDHVVYEWKGGRLFTLGEAWRELEGVGNCAIIRATDDTVVMRRRGINGWTEFRCPDGVYRNKWDRQSVTYRYRPRPRIECCPDVWLPYPNPGRIVACPRCGTRFELMPPPERQEVQAA